MAVFIYPPVQVTIPGAATEATLQQILTETQTANATLTSIDGKDFATETTLAALEAKALTDAQLRATPVAVSGPLTDTELRAVPVPVSGTVSTGGLTDAELRAAPVAVSGPVTDAELRAAPVAVSGPLTDTELRAAPVDVLGPLTDTELRAAPVPVSGPLTDTQLRATPVAVSGTVTADAGAGTFAVSAAALPLPAGAATEATLALLNDRLAGSLAPVEHDEVEITYVGSTTRISTVVFKLASLTVRTLTLTYDGSDRLIDVVAS